MNQRYQVGSIDGTITLTPPGCDKFWVSGYEDTNQRAAEWADANQYLLYAGPSGQCVHGLYVMANCDNQVCSNVGMDHTSIWVSAFERDIFILTHPYVDKIPDKLLTYATMHGLSATSWRKPDGWYGSGAMPIRLGISPDWPLWPIEREVALIKYHSPIAW